MSDDKTISPYYSAAHKQPNKGAADILNTMLWIIGSDGRGVAVNYSHIEEIDTDNEKQRLRVFLPRAIVDITTNDIAGLVAAIGRRKVARLEVGEVSDTVQITSITIYDNNTLPNPNQ